MNLCWVNPFHAAWMLRFFSIFIFLFLDFFSVVFLIQAKKAGKLTEWAFQMGAHTQKKMNMHCQVVHKIFLALNSHNSTSKRSGKKINICLQMYKLLEHEQFSLWPHHRMINKCKGINENNNSENKNTHTQQHRSKRLDLNRLQLLYSTNVYARSSIS